MRSNLHNETASVVDVTFSEATKMLRELADKKAQAQKAITSPLEQVEGHYLARDVCALFDRPQADISAMDGYAIFSGDLPHMAKKGLPDGGVFCRAGDIPLPHRSQTAARILTGARLPQGADQVIAQENIRHENGRTYLSAPANSLGMNVRYKGEEFKKGDCLIKAGSRLSWPEIALLASQNIQHVPIMKPPVIGILANGWEFNEAAGDHRYDINTPMLKAMLAPLCLDIKTCNVASDNRTQLKEGLGHLLCECDIVITTGGISVGSTDNVYPLLEELGCELLFRRVLMKPGKPATVMNHARSTVFSLPGNPGAAAICALMFVLPFIARLQGSKKPSLQTIEGKLTFSHVGAQKRAHFLLVSLSRQGDELLISQVKTKGASDISSLHKAQGVIVLQPCGDCVQGQSWRVSLFPS